MSKIKIDWDKIATPEPVLTRFPSRRSVVYSTKGIVAASQPLAVEAGLEILRKGGNAGWSLKTSAALNVTEPSCCGIGGDAFCLFYDAKTKTVKALNGSGHSPQKLTLEYLRERGVTGTSIPLTDLNSVTVPGAAAAWVDTVERFGSGKVTVAEVLAPAIRLAEEGVPVSEIHSLAWQHSEMLLNGKAPLQGQIMKFPNLAQTFKEVATHGKDGYYKGRVAQAIVDLIQSQGGVMDLEDLAKHKTSFVEPIKYTYADEVTLYECPPNGQGLTALIALGILENLQEQGLTPLLDMAHNSPEYLHVLIEALRFCCPRFPVESAPDTQWYVADPEIEHVPVEKLLSKEYLASRAKLINPLKTNPEVVHGNPANSSDTVYFTVADQWGNACSYIQSNYAGCGFTLQNRGSGFVLKENHPNVLKGGKRPYHTIIPAMVTRGDELFLSYGVMGGYMQPQGHIQVLQGMLRGYTPQAALDSPRFCISAGLPDSESKDSGNAGDINSEVYIEEGIPQATIDKLKEMGHDARPATGFQRGMFGRGQVIQKITDSSGQFVWAAGSDLRADGHASPQI
ncbi:gamma-glutamyltranspeptidase [Mycena alexandri]|uniref:Gamma-glutamyltranspeptidase n=1 Tax=Mycena alexandri TaxID=1745969 RepID=A0AAD6XAN6_9AGAR|nr:gamma-glutamyltranspeptidase [Mycena alexandri]